MIGVAGWFTPRLIHEVTHNRTINLNGGKGRNIPMDRVCEFYNAELKLQCRIFKTINNTNIFVMNNPFSLPLVVTLSNFNARHTES